jgi:ankyrin repeat protein
MESQAQKDLKAVLADGNAIRYIETQTDEMALAAVSDDGFTIRHVHNQTTEIALAAVKQNGYAIRHVKNQTPEVILAAWNQVGNELLNFSVRLKLNTVTAALLSHGIHPDHVSVLHTDPPFISAIVLNDLSTMQLLFNHGADIHAKMSDCNQNVLSWFLHRVAINKKIEPIPVIVKLLEMGIDPTEPDKNGCTALSTAKDNPEILSVINSFQIKKIVKSAISEYEIVATKRKQHF